MFFNRFGKQLSEQSIRRIVNNTTEIIGISKKVTPKMLRDTLAGNMLKQNYSVRQLQSFLGDKSLMTTEKRAKTIEMGNIQVFNPVSVYL